MRRKVGIGAGAGKENGPEIGLPQDQSRANGRRSVVNFSSIFFAGKVANTVPGSQNCAASKKVAVVTANND
jgi:hypothetical protein